MLYRSLGFDLKPGVSEISEIKTSVARAALATAASATFCSRCRDCSFYALSKLIVLGLVNHLPTHSDSPIDSTKVHSPTQVGTLLRSGFQPEKKHWKEGRKDGTNEKDVLTNTELWRPWWWRIYAPFGASCEVLWRNWGEKSSRDLT